MQKRISKVVIALWIVIGILVAYDQYQWHELEKVEHEVDLMYDIVR